MKIRTILAALILSLAFVSCDDDGDTTKPVIDLQEPETDEQVTLGGEMHFLMEISDDVELSSYKLNIHYNDPEDSHTHTSVTKSDNSDIIITEFPWTQEFDDCAGQRNATIHYHIQIPSDATAGEYHLAVYCVDAAGNESVVYRSVYFVEPEE